MPRTIPSGTTVQIAAHHSDPGKGLSYVATAATLVDPCETQGWDVIDVTLPDGSRTSVYSFSVEREPETINVLSIDAWADGEGGWTWNQWHKVGSCSLATCDLEPAAIIQFMIDEGYLQAGAADRCEVDDDQYNMVIIDADTREPLFALEYGPAVA